MLRKNFFSFWIRILCNTWVSTWFSLVLTSRCGIPSAGTKVWKGRFRTSSIRVTNSKWFRTCLSLVWQQWWGQHSQVRSFTNLRCRWQSSDVVAWVLSRSDAAFPWKQDYRRCFCTAHFNWSVGLTTCELRLFDKTAKQESSLRSGSGRPVWRQQKRRWSKSAQCRWMQWRVKQRAEHDMRARWWIFGRQRKQKNTAMWAWKTWATRTRQRLQIREIKPYPRLIVFHIAHSSTQISTISSLAHNPSIGAHDTHHIAVARAWPAKFDHILWYTDHRSTSKPSGIIKHPHQTRKNPARFRSHWIVRTLCLCTHHLQVFYHQFRLLNLTRTNKAPVVLPASQKRHTTIPDAINPELVRKRDDVSSSGYGSPQPLFNIVAASTMMSCNFGSNVSWWQVNFFCNQRSHGVFEIRSVRMWYGHTTTFISEYCRRNTQRDDTAPTGFKNVCARNTKRRPDYWGKCQSLDLQLYLLRQRLEGDKCGLRGVRVFTPALLSTYSGSSEALIVVTIFQSTATTDPTTNSSTNHPIETATKKMGVLVALPAWELLPAILCFCSRYQTICTARWYSVSCFTSRATFALCLILSLPECIRSRNWRNCWSSASPSSFLIRPLQLCSSSFECPLMNIWFLYRPARNVLWINSPGQKNRIRIM